MSPSLNNSLPASDAQGCRIFTSTSNLLFGTAVLSILVEGRLASVSKEGVAFCNVLIEIKVFESVMVFGDPQRAHIEIYGGCRAHIIYARRQNWNSTPPPNMMIERSCQLRRCSHHTAALQRHDVTAPSTHACRRHSRQLASVVFCIQASARAVVHVCMHKQSD